MASGRKAKRVRRQRGRLRRHALPAVSASHSNEAQPDPSSWAFLAVWERQPALWGLALCAMVAVSHYPVPPGRVCPGRQYLHRGTGGSRLVRSMEYLVLAGRHRAGRALLAGHVHDVLAGAQLWGLAPFSCHLVNVLFYMVNVLLLWRLLRRLAVRAPGPWPRYSPSTPCTSSRWPGPSDARTCSPAFSTWPRHFAGSVRWRVLAIAGPTPAALRPRGNIGFRDPPGGAGRLTPSASRARASTWRRWDCSWRPCVEVGGGHPAGGVRDLALVGTRASDVDGYMANRPFLLVALAIALADLSYCTSGGNSALITGLPSEY